MINKIKDQSLIVISLSLSWQLYTSSKSTIITGYNKLIFQQPTFLQVIRLIEKKKSIKFSKSLYFFVAVKFDHNKKQIVTCQNVCVNKQTASNKMLPPLFVAFQTISSSYLPKSFPILFYKQFTKTQEPFLSICLKAT
jgi:hypothetical protein